MRATIAVALCTALFGAVLTTAAQAHEFNGPVVISEFLAANSSGIVDADGDTSDWIELHNQSDITVDLDGWELRDSGNRWAFPPVSLAAGNYLVVWASGKNRTGDELHTNFRLSAAGEALVLLQPSGELASSYTPSYPPQHADVSYGVTDGSVGFFTTPTPGAANTAPGQGPADPPVAATGRGVYVSTFSETLTTTTDGAVIRYTVDGSEPDETSSVYSGPIVIDSTEAVVTIRARTYAAGYEPSKESSWSYVFPSSALPEYPDSAQHIPNGLSIVVLNDADGGAFSQGSDVPARGRFEYLDLGGEGFSIGAGFAITGATGKPPSSRIHFDSEYGASKLEYPLFADVGRGSYTPATTFDKLDLRNFSNDAGGSGGYAAPYYVSDRFWKDTFLDLGVLAPHGRYVHVYRGGEYSGLMHLREVFGAAFHAEYDSGGQSDYASVFYEALHQNQVFKTIDGSASDWTQVNQLSGNYQSIKDHIDVRSFIALGFFNGYVEYSREGEFRYSGRRWGVDAGRWIAMHNDNDWEVGRITHLGALFGRRNWPTYYVNRWRNDSDFRLEVAAMAQEAFCPGGAMAEQAMLDRFDETVAQLERGIVPTMMVRHGAGWETKLQSTRHAQAYARSRIENSASSRYDRAVSEGFLTSCEQGPIVKARSSMHNIVGDDVDYTIPALASGDAQIASYQVGSLPDGLTVEASTGRISGSVTTPGQYVVSITVSDSAGLTTTDSIDWSVEPAGTPTTPLVLNEYNAVAQDRQLGEGSGADSRFGTVDGNGGDWLELVVTSAGADLRGVQIELWDRDRSASELRHTNTFVLSDHEVLASVPAGSILTIAEDLPDDTTLDVGAGDWNLQAGVNNLGQSELVTFGSQANFDTNNDVFHVLVRSSDGSPMGSYQGETDTFRSAYGNVTDTTVFALCEAPTTSMPSSDGAEAVDTSTFGGANTCRDGLQDLGALRGMRGDVNCDLVVATADVVNLLEFFVGTRSSHPCPLGDPALHVAARQGDRDLDGDVDIRDGMVTAQCITHPSANPHC